MTLNRNDFDERRDYYRMAVDCEAELLDPRSGERFTARVQDLSGAGVSFFTSRRLAAGDELELRIEALLAGRPPLRARVEVLRVDAAPEGCTVAAAIRDLLE